MNTLPELERLQKEVALLIANQREKNINSDCSYIEAVKHSAGLRVIRWSISQWRKYNLIRCCPLTMRALHCAGEGEEMIARYSEQGEFPALVADLRQLFLDFVSNQGSSLVAAFARYETILPLCKEHSEAEWIITWPCSPNDAFDAVATGQPLPMLTVNKQYRICAGKPHVFVPVES